MDSSTGIQHTISLYRNIYSVQRTTMWAIYIEPCASLRVALPFLRLSNQSAPTPHHHPPSPALNVRRTEYSLLHAQQHASDGYIRASNINPVKTLRYPTIQYKVSLLCMFGIPALTASKYSSHSDNPVLNLIHLNHHPKCHHPEEVLDCPLCSMYSMEVNVFGRPHSSGPWCYF